MQTFLPFPSFELSAQTLDNRRLNKQSVECYQIGLILWRKKGWLPNPTNKKGFWNHPAVRIWEDSEFSFLEYWSAIIKECNARSINTKLLQRRWEELESAIPWNFFPWSLFSLAPAWLGNPDFHASHQSNLKRKDPIYYPFPLLPSNLPYIWPKNEQNAI